MTQKQKKRLATISLILCTFFNPLGFDALFALVMKWTNSYWTTDIIFYCISLLFFIIYLSLNNDTKAKYLLFKAKVITFFKEIGSQKTI